jgi:peroxiredoxin
VSCEPSAHPAETGETLESRLFGLPLPDVQLQYAHEAFATIAVLAQRWSLVIFFYPGAKESLTTIGESVGRDERRAVSWLRCEAELASMGYEIIGVSAQSAIEQARFASRDPLPYMLLSDPQLKLAQILGLPTTGQAAQRVYEPLTIVVHEQRIARVFHPIDPAHEARTVMRWIRSNPSR